MGWVKKLWDRFRAAVISINVVRIVLEWLGWKQLVIGLLLSVGGGAWAMIQGVPTSITVMAAFCVLVGMLYLFMLPALVAARGAPEDRSNRPDPEIWRHVVRLTLGQASCLLADITPEGEESVPWGDADGWYQGLRLAIEGGEITREKSPHDARHSFDGVYRPFEGTWISRDSLRKFADKRAVRRAFLRDD